MSVDVVVIGAGISGLAVACALRQRGHSVLVLERQARVGGKAISERVGGFLMEHGPSSVNGASAEALCWSRVLELEDGRLELGSGVKRRYLTAGDRLHGISTHWSGFLTSGYLSWPARLRLFAEIAVPRGNENESETVAEFCRRRFGKEFVARVIDPLVGGMFAGDADKLAVASVFPALAEMERRHGSIIRGLIQRRRSEGRMPGRMLFSWRDGIGVMPAALASRCGDAIKTGVTVRRIVPQPRGFQVDGGASGSVSASTVIIATQPHAAAALLENMDSRAAAAAAAIDAPPLAVVFLGFERRQLEHPLDGIGYLTPSAEQRALTGTLFCSTMFEDRAPEGYAALAGYAGGARSPELALLPPDELTAIARTEFATLLGAKGEPIVSRHRLWHRGLPQYEVGHSRLVAMITSASERTPGLFITGNYLRGVSISACLEQASETTELADRFCCEQLRRGQNNVGRYGRVSGQPKIG